jgi:hypothetical protein
MFETLHDPTDGQIEIAVGQLQQGIPVLFLCDPSGVYLSVRPCPNHEVDFAAVTMPFSLVISPMPLTGAQADVLHVWTGRLIPRLLARWRELFPILSSSASGEA